MKIAWRYLACAWFACLALPLMLVSFARPFGWWDYLTTLAHRTPDASEFGFAIWGLYVPYDYTQPFSLVRNYTYHVFTDPVVLRPTMGVLFNIQGLAFGGEFWLWYLVKWAAEFAAIGLAVWILTRLQVPPAARWLVAAVLLFHPCDFELMVCSADGWTALGAMAVLAIAVGQPQFSESPFDLGKFSGQRYLALLAVWFLMLGVKENSVVSALVFALLLTWRAPRQWLRLLPFHAALLWWIWRLYVVSQSRLKGKEDVDVVGNVVALLRLLIPDSPFSLLGVVFVAALLFGGWQLWQSRQSERFLLFAFGVLAGLGTLLMSARYYPAPRYDVPCVYLLALSLGLALSYVPRLTVPACVLAALIPLWQAPNLYSQALAYQQLFLEYSDVIHLIENKMAAGYAFALPGGESIAGETQAELSLFFRQFGPRFYSLPPQPAPYVLKKDGIPNKPFVLLAPFGSDEIPGLAPDRIRSVEAFRRGRYGVIERLTQRYGRVAAWFGVPKRVAYDLGAPMVSDVPAFRVITVEPTGIPSPVSWLDATATICTAAGGKQADPGCSIQINGERYLGARFSLGQWNGIRNWTVDGRIRVEEGEIAVGIGDREGRDLWNALMTAKPEWQAVPSPATALNGTGKEYTLFVFVPQGKRARFSIASLRASVLNDVRFLEPFRRYGAIGM